MFEAWRSQFGQRLSYLDVAPRVAFVDLSVLRLLSESLALLISARRKANEPLHILWDSYSNKIKVANNTGKDFKGLHAEAWIYNLDGTQKSAIRRHRSIRRPMASPPIAST